MIAKTGFLFSCLLSFTIFFFLNHNTTFTTEKLLIKKPNDCFYIQRAFPKNEINFPAYKHALLQAEELKSAQLNKTTTNNWTFAGPTIIGGRIADIEINSLDDQTIYAGTATGGVIKSTPVGKVVDIRSFAHNPLHSFLASVENFI